MEEKEEIYSLECAGDFIPSTVHISTTVNRVWMFCTQELFPLPRNRVPPHVRAWDGAPQRLRPRSDTRHGEPTTAIGIH